MRALTLAPPSAAHRASPSSSSPNDVLVEHRGGRRGAVPEAVDRLERDAAIGRGAAQLDAEFLLGMRSECIGAHGLAGFGAAELQHMPPRRLLRKS